MVNIGHSVRDHGVLVYPHSCVMVYTHFFCQIKICIRKAISACGKDHANAVSCSCHNKVGWEEGGFKKILGSETGWWLMSLV